MPLTDTQIFDIEERLRRRCKMQKIKFESDEYFKTQTEFFAGIITAFSALGIDYDIPERWIVGLMHKYSLVRRYNII